MQPSFPRFAKAEAFLHDDALAAATLLLVAFNVHGLGRVCAGAVAAAG